MHYSNLCCHPEEISSSPILECISEYSELYIVSNFHDIRLGTHKRKHLVYHSHHCGKSEAYVTPNMTLHMHVMA
jgi:hypothetical protein